MADGQLRQQQRVQRALHPRHGIHEPTAGTPPRVPIPALLDLAGTNLEEKP